MPFAGYDEAHASPLTMPVSVLVPAWNEAVGIVESVRGMLALRYPEFEVVVVDDGSTDDTFDLLCAAFDLRPVPREVPDDVHTRGAADRRARPADRARWWWSARRTAAAPTR